MIAMLTFNVSCSVVFAGPLEDGLAAANRGDYATALRLWRPLADQGNADAQYNIGAVYDKALGVTRDSQEAVKWWRLAAAQGNQLAQYNLAVAYAQGRGTAQDFERSYMWFKIAAAHGLTAAEEKRVIILKRLTGPQYNSAQEMARRCEASNYQQCD